MRARVCVCVDPLKSLSVNYHICQTRLWMIIEDDLNLSTPPFARPLILIKGRIFPSLFEKMDNVQGEGTASPSTVRQDQSTDILSWPAQDRGISSPTSFLSIFLALLPLSFYLLHLFCRSSTNINFLWISYPLHDSLTSGFAAAILLLCGFKSINPNLFSS